MRKLTDGMKKKRNAAMNASGDLAGGTDF